MRIGIDLDGVVFDSEEEFKVYTELYDELVLKQNSKKDSKALRFQDRFNWTEENEEDFLKIYHEKIVKTANYMPGAKEVLKMLKDEGHTLIMITARGGLNTNIVELTKERLKNDNMDIFDKYYYQVEEKDKVCLNENVDIMIDDYYKNCIAVAEAGIKTIYFKAACIYDLEENDNLKTLYNWGEIYRYIKEIEKK